MTTSTLAANPPTTEAKGYNSEDLRQAVHHWASKIGVKVQQIHLRQMNQVGIDVRHWALNPQYRH